eukprot:2995718-Amphidinium_carterae.1
MLIAGCELLVERVWPKDWSLPLGQFHSGSHTGETKKSLPAKIVANPMFNSFISSDCTDTSVWGGDVSGKYIYLRVVGENDAGIGTRSSSISQEALIVVELPELIAGCITANHRLHHRNGQQQPKQFDFLYISWRLPGL